MKANTFIVGAPKCGTTALSEYLKAHPQVMMSVPKEPYFFADDLPGLKARTGYDSLDKYHSLFRSASNQHRVICDASVYYLYSEVALEKIFQYNRDAKIIVMLRNPVDMVYSYFSQLLFLQFENTRSFEGAWDKQEERRDGVSIPGRCPDRKVLMYGDIARFATQMKRLLGIFDKKNVLIVLFEDFSVNTEREYIRTLDFLGLERIVNTPLQRINENKRLRYVLVKRMIDGIPDPIRVSIRSIKNLMGIRLSVGALINRLNVAKESRPPLEAAFRQRVYSHYLEDICELESLIDKDLSCWKTTSA